MPIILDVSARIGRRFFSHVPVMADEVIQILKPDHGKVFIDMTFGGGGHTKRLLESNKSITVIAVDRDPVAYKKAQELAAHVARRSERLNIKQKVIPVHGRFSRVMRDIHLNGVHYGTVNGVMFDLGASSMQYDNSERGFAVSSEGPLDMRMDTSSEGDLKAEDVVNTLSETELAFIFKTLGGERRSRKISSAIIDARALIGRIRTTRELGRIIESVSKGYRTDSLGRYAHPATKTFQALRIFVNNELNELNYALEKVREFLIPNFVDENSPENRSFDPTREQHGVAIVLSFHSLEDTIVKRHFSGIDPNEPEFKWLSQHDRIRTNHVIKSQQQLENFGENRKWRSLLKHVILPSDAEVAANPRSRSAKLRSAMRIEPSSQREYIKNK